MILDALADGGAEVLQAHGQVALIDVVGAHADLDQLVDQLLHGEDAVVDAGQQHALVAQGIPASASMAQALADSGVISLGWLKWVFSHRGDTSSACCTARE